MGNDKPRLGIALGSGSARGWAHIGVLQALIEMGVKPDIVAGTSAGALVGACYAAGKLDLLEEWALSLDWKDMVGLLDVRFIGGLIEGRKLFRFFEQHMDGLRIKDLQLPFGAVCTDLENGRELWLRSGLVIEAVRASISLPGVFRPYRTNNNRFLVDGGLVNPVPISLARAMGADIVIAVNLNAEIVGKHLRSNSRNKLLRESRDEAVNPPPIVEENSTEKNANTLPRETQIIEEKNQPEWLKRMAQWFSADENDAPPQDNLPGLMEVVATSINIMQDRVTRSRMAGDPPDLVITPRLSHIAILEYYRAKEAIDEGRQAVCLAKPQIEALLS
jgi:NTE family protein